MNRLSQKFTTQQRYLDELERIGKRWVAQPRGDYSDLQTSGLLPRGL